jgi:hypothetical protein
MPKRPIREPGHLSIRAYAARRGSDPKEVRKALAKGIIALEPDGYLDPAKADAAWERNANPAYRHAHNRYPDTGLAAVRTKTELMRGEMAEERLHERRAALIERDAAEALLTRWQRLVRDGFASWPARIAPKMARELGVDPERLRRVLDTHVGRQLAERPEEDVSDLFAAARRRSGQ